MTARVLVVDDNPVNVKLLEAKLFAEYYEVLSAEDGPSAIRLVETEMPDIVLLDVMMPGMDGYEVCQKIKSNPALTHIPVVMVTALNEMRDRVKGLEVGADDFLTKPVDDVALFARIRSLVRFKQTVDELRAREATGADLGIPMDTVIDLDAKTPGRILLANEGGWWDYDKVEEIIKKDGHEVVYAPDYATAIKLSGESDFHLVLLHDCEDGEDALRLCSQLRSDPETRNMHILLVVDDGYEDRLVKALELGVTDYLVRPIDKDELIARTRTQVRRKCYEDSLRMTYQENVSAAITDSLTKLYNRCYLEVHFEREVTRLADSGKQLLLMMLDIDHFKVVNDTHGHSVGDEVLQSIAKRILSNLRGIDTAIRFGGEEFVVLMPNARLEDATNAAERLRGTIASSPTPASNGEEGIDITVSIGVATAMAGTQILDELLKRADAALYQAKNGGRNQVVAVSENGDMAPWNKQVANG